MGVVRWVLYYSDGSSFSDKDGAPHESPGWGVVAIAQDTRPFYDEVLASGAPWYVFRADTGFWQELDETGYLDCMVHHARFVMAVRPGRYIRRDHFMALWARARARVQEWTHG